jgi:unspecific monooxygenase
MDGPSNQKRRRLLLPIFSTLQVKRMLPVITAIANRSIDCWPRKGAFALQTHLQRISARVVMAGIFGADDTDSTTNLASSVARLSEIGMNSPLLLMRALQWDLGSGSPWGRIVRLVRETRAVIRAAVELRRSELPNDRSDAMSVLVGLSNEQDSLSNEAIIDELIALSIAAYETTHVATAWVFACLLSARPSLERVREEVCGSTGEDTVLDLPYLDAVVRESLRLRPASPICGGRMILRPITIGDFLLPIGMIATNCSYLLHRRPDLFPDPATFRPERFLGAPTVATTTFGGGGRSCPGRPLALAEIKVVVATALARVDLRLCRPPVPAVARGIHLVPRHGLTVEAR